MTDLGFLPLMNMEIFRVSNFLKLRSFREMRERENFEVRILNAEMAGKRSNVIKLVKDQLIEIRHLAI